MEGREVLVLEGFGSGREVVDDLRASVCSSPCLAADAAVGAVRREGRPTGRVGDLGRGFLKPLGEVLPELTSRSARN